LSSSTWWQVFNSPPAVGSSEEILTPNGTPTNQAYSATVKEHLRATYGHLVGGLVMTGGFGYLFHRAGWSARLMTVSKWVSIGGTLVLTLGSCVATQMINQHQNPVWKYTAWTLFNSSLGLVLSPLFYLKSSLLAHAALLSAGIVTSISAVAMTARREQYLWLGAPLSKFSMNISLNDLYGLVIGLDVICLASIGSKILPATAIRTLSVMEGIWLYGGLVVFSGVLLVDTQKMIANAEKAQDARALSSIDESLDIYLDSINIFIRILTLLSGDNERKKKQSSSTDTTN
jgi:FtsH-binding integral membrane protein